MPDINLDKTIVILVGISSYEEPLHKLPASIENVSSLSSAFQNKVGIGVERILRLFDYKHDDFLEAIENFIEEKNNIENIIFYYAGHALPSVVNNDDSVDYFITARNTNPDKDRTKINCKELFRSLRKNNTANLIAIFDCCFSGNIYDSLSQKADCFVIASSAADEFSIYPLNETLSTFTAKFIKVLNTGIPKETPDDELSFRQIFQYVSQLLRNDQAPVPVSGGAGTIGDVTFVKNYYIKEPELATVDYEREVNDLYYAIILEEGQLYRDVEGSEQYNTLFGAYLRIEDEYTKAKPENVGNIEFLKSLVLKRYPIIISYLLKKFLYPDKETEKQLTYEFYSNIYTHILKLLCFISIKDLADHKKLDTDYKDLIAQIWGPVDRKWHFNVLKKAFNYSNVLQIKEFTQNSDFFKSILFIEYKYFKSMSETELTELFIPKNELEKQREIISFKRENDEFNFRSALFDLVKNLAFFVKYDMVAIKLIKVVRGYFQPVSFTHDISDLYGDSYDEYRHTLITKDKCYHNGTVMILPKRANPEKILQDEEYVNLWPLIIDKNGSNNDTTKAPEIHIFQYAEEDSLTFYYRIATDENRMFSGKPNKYNDLIRFPSLAERKAYFKYFKNNIGLENGEAKTT